MQFRAHEADLALDVPDGLTAPPGPSKEFDITGIGHRIVSRDQAQQRALAAAVGAGQHPMFSFPHRPVQTVQDHPLSETDRNPAQADHRRREHRLEIRFARHLGARHTVRHRDHMRDERRDLRHAREHQHERHRGGERSEQPRERGPRGRVQPDIGIVDDQHGRPAQQGARELEFAQLARRERDQRLVQHRSEGKQGGQFLQPPGGRSRIRARGRFLAQLLPCGGRVVLQRKEVPALLHEEIAVAVAAVGITERDVPRPRAACKGGGDPALAGGVAAHQGDLFTGKDLQHHPTTF